MKQEYLAAAVAIVALAGGTGSAGAEPFSLGEAYIKGFAGASWPSGLDTTLTEDGDQIALPSFDHDTGYSLGVAVGAAVSPNVLMEVEYAYRDADFIVSDRDEGDQGEGVTSANALMLNALYLFDGMDASGAMRPYVGAGIGAANVEKSAGGQDFDSGNVFAFQVIGGIDYALNPGTSLYAEGRWFQTASGDFGGPDGESFDGEFKSFDVIVGMRFVFGAAK